MKPVTVLSLFDGMSCGLVSLKRIGIPVAKYYASEIDKYAIQVAKKNHPEIEELGDINDWKEWDIDVPDIVLAGSPCQGFSVAGRGLNFDDPRSKLFFVFIDILNHWRKINPDIKFLLENVKMKGEWRDIITSYMGVEPILINSALVSAQNRQRYYWTNVEGVEQPEDRGIVLADILEDGEVDREKSYSIDANYHKGGNPRLYFEDGRRQLVFENQSQRRAMVKTRYSPSDLGGKAKTLSTHSRVIGANGTTVVPAGLVFVAGLEKGRRLDDGNSFSRNYREGSRIYSPAGKAASLTAKPKGGEGGYTGLYQVGEASDIKGHGYNRRVYSAEGKAPTVNSHQGGNLEPKVATDEIHYRKLTVVECERLQTLEDNYTAGVSNTQRYKMIGNGWTIEVIAHILNQLQVENV